MRQYLYSLATDKKKGFIAGGIKFFLFILSLIYGLIVRILSFLYHLKPYRLNAKVISVGNITLGGTGKTPLVEMLAGLLKDKGHRVAILTRGYKRLATRYSWFDKFTTPRVILSNAEGLSNTRFEAIGDEPYMLSRNLDNISVVVDRDRVKAGERVIRECGVDTLILDDGFQQWRVKKDLDIVTVDTTNPLGNLHLLPRGILREPISSLRRADIFILTKVNFNPDNQKIKQFLSRINPGALIVESIHKPSGFYKFGCSRDVVMGPDEFRGRKVTLVCGIADPQSFEDIIRDLGIDIILSFRFPDHYVYTEDDLDKIINNSKQKGINTIITTEKDSVRFPIINYKLTAMSPVRSESPKATAAPLPWTSNGVSCLILRIKLEILQYEIFVTRIHSLY